MNFLTQDQRDRAVRILSQAPDDILLSAMVDYSAWKHRMDGAKLNLDAVMDELSDKAVVPAPVTVAKEKRQNTSPGISIISKIGQNAKDDIFSFLKRGIQPPAKYIEHMKLLWSRNEILYDGRDFYLDL